MKKITLKIKSMILDLLNHPKKKIAFISVAVAVALLICLTFAWFISQSNLIGSIFKTGTIDFTAQGYDENGTLVTTILPEGKPTEGVPLPNEPLFDKTGWSVSSVGTSYISVEKTGTLDMEYDLSFVAGGQTEYLGGYWYRVKEITYDLLKLEGTDAQKLAEYAKATENAAIPCDAGSSAPVTCIMVEDKIVHGCTESKETSNNMTTIDRSSTRGVLDNITQKRVYRIEYGVRQVSQPTEYTNKTISVTTKIYASQIGAINNQNDRGKTFTVSDSKSINEAIDNALPGDSILLANDITYEGDLVFNKCINFIAAGKTLTVKGNMIYNFVSAHTLKIDLSGIGKLKVVTNGAAGGNFTLNTPNSQVELVGGNTAGDLHVSKNMTVNATRALGTGGCIFSNITILNDTNLPKEIYVSSDTRLTINSGVKISRIEALAQVTNIEIQNSGEIDNIILSSMNMLANAKSPQIYIHNYSKINNPILLPKWSQKFDIVSTEPLLTTGNTKIVRAFGATDMDVKGSDKFTKNDIIDETRVEKFVEPITAGDDTALKVYFRDKEAGTNSTLQKFLEDYFAEKGLNGFGLIGAIQNIKKLEIITIGNKVISDADVVYMNKSLISLAAIDMSKANIVNNTLISAAFQNKTTLVSIQLPNTLTTINADVFKGTAINQITIPASVNFAGVQSLRSIKYITFESYVPGDYIAANLNDSYIFVNESVVETYRTAFAGLSNRIYPKAQMCDDEVNFVRELSNGTYELTLYTGNETNIVAGNDLRVNYKSITVSTIGESAFRNSKHSFTLAFAPSVQSIGYRAFYTTLVKSIDFANVKTVGIAAFSNCTQIIKLDTKNVETLNILAFGGCTNLIEVNFPSMKTLVDSGDNANSGVFTNCVNLTTVSFYSIEYLGASVFSGCKNLREAYIYNPNAQNISSGYYTFNFPLKNFRLYTLKENVSVLKAKGTLPANNIYEMGEKVGSNIIRLRGTIDGNENTLLGEIDVGQYIVAGSKNNATLVCCNSVTPLGKSYTVPSSIKEIDSTISDEKNKAITTVGDYAFFHNSFSSTDLVFGNNIKAVGAYAFNAPAVDAVDFKNVTTVGNYAFISATVSSIDFGCVTNIGNYTFASCQNLKTIDKDNEIQYIANNAFSYCSRLYQVNLPKIIRIGNQDTTYVYSFRSCPSLTSVDLGNTCTELRHATFADCDNLREIFIRSTDGVNTKIRDFIVNTSTDVLKKVKIYVPAEARNDYRAQLNMDVFYELGRKVGSNTVTVTYGGEVLGNVELGEYMVRDVPGGISVSSYNVASANVAVDYKLPSKIDGKDIVRIGAGCFVKFPFEKINFGSGNTDNFIFPETLKEIGDYAFMSTAVKVGDFKNIENISQYSFQYCANLYEVIAPNLKSVGARALFSCSNLRVVNAPKLTTIDYYGIMDNVNLVQLITDAQNVGTNGIGGGSALREVWVATTPNATVNYTIPASPKYATYTAADKITGTYQYDCARVERTGSAPQEIKDSLGNLLCRYDLGTYMVENVPSGKRIVYCNILGTVTGTTQDPFEILGSVDGYPVVEIGRAAFAAVNFKNCVIDIPYSLKKIGTYAFTGKNISGNLDLKQVESIDTWAFANTGIQSINAPKLTSVGATCFQGCTSLVSVSMPIITRISAAVFNLCANLKTLYFEEAVTFDNWTALGGCTSISSVTINKVFTKATDLPNLGVVIPSSAVFVVPSVCVELYKASAYFGKYMIQPLGETVIDETGNKFSLIEKYDGWELLYCTNAVSDLVIPADYNGKNVVSISSYAFSSATPISVTLPQYYKYYMNDIFIGNNTIQNIHVHADNSHFQSIDGVLYTKDGVELVYYPKNRLSGTYTVADNTKMICSYAFKNNGVLKGVVFPHTISVIGAEAFSGTLLDYAVFQGGTAPMMTGTSIFDTSNAGLKIYVPEGKVGAYQTATGFIEYDIGNMITDDDPPIVPAVTAALPPEQNTKKEDEEGGEDQPSTSGE